MLLPNWFTIYNLNRFTVTIYNLNRLTITDLHAAAQLMLLLRHCQRQLRRNVTMHIKSNGLVIGGANSKLYVVGNGLRTQEHALLVCTLKSHSGYWEWEQGKDTDHEEELPKRRLWQTGMQHEGLEPTDRQQAQVRCYHKGPGSPATHLSILFTSHICMACLHVTLHCFQSHYLQKFIGYSFMFEFLYHITYNITHEG